MPRLHALVDHYKNEVQPPVEYILGSWQRTLRSWPQAALILDDDRWNHSADRPGRRLVDRYDLARLLDETDLEDESAVRAAFTLVMVWGSGTSNG